MAAAVAEAERHWGGLDAAVAAAGVIAGGVPLWEMPDEQQRAVLDTDLGGVIGLARAAIPALLRRPEPRSGRFLAVASAAATRGLPMLAAYCAAKRRRDRADPGAGRRARRDRRHRERGQPGVHGHTDPGRDARLYGLPGVTSFAAQQPVQRLLDPDEVAAALVWLAGDGTGAITGAVLPVDGGLAL